jgi:hypothetical protein
MRRIQPLLIGLLVFGVGYVMGAGGYTWPEFVHAQQAPGEQPPAVSEESAAKIKEARYALQAAMESLNAEGRYESITAELNAFLILSGGGNAREDLEAGRGVDPETFAALYAGLAVPDVADLLTFDEKNRLTYKNKVVRMYSVSRLQQLYQQRLKFAETAL